MLHISSVKKPTSFIACLILMVPLAAAVVPAAQDDSSSTLSVPSDVINEESCMVLAHFFFHLTMTCGLFARPHSFAHQRRDFPATVHVDILTTGLAANQLQKTTWLLDNMKKRSVWLWLLVVSLSAVQLVFGLLE